MSKGKFQAPTLSVREYKNLDAKSMAVFAEAIKVNDEITLNFITQADLDTAEQGRTIGTDPTLRYFVYVSGVEGDTSKGPRISLNGLARPTYRDSECQNVVKALWNDNCVNIPANGHKSAVAHAQFYNSQVEKHQDANGVCKIRCKYVGRIAELKGRGDAVYKDVVYRVWEWVTPA